MGSTQVTSATSPMLSAQASKTAQNTSLVQVTLISSTIPAASITAEDSSTGYSQVTTTASESSQNTTEVPQTSSAAFSTSSYPNTYTTTQALPTTMFNSSSSVEQSTEAARTTESAIASEIGASHATSNTTVSIAHSTSAAQIISVAETTKAASTSDLDNIKTTLPGSGGADSTSSIAQTLSPGRNNDTTTNVFVNPSAVAAPVTEAFSTSVNDGGNHSTTKGGGGVQIPIAAPVPENTSSLSSVVDVTKSSQEASATSDQSAVVSTKGSVSSTKYVNTIAAMPSNSTSDLCWFSGYRPSSATLSAPLTSSSGSWSFIIQPSSFVGQSSLDIPAGGQLAAASTTQSLPSQVSRSSLMGFPSTAAASSQRPGVFSSTVNAKTSQAASSLAMSPGTSLATSTLSPWSLADLSSYSYTYTPKLVGLQHSFYRQLCIFNLFVLLWNTFIHIY